MAGNGYKSLKKLEMAQNSWNVKSHDQQVLVLEIAGMLNLLTNNGKHYLPQRFTCHKFKQIHKLFLFTRPISLYHVICGQSCPWHIIFVPWFSTAPQTDVVVLLGRKFQRADRTASTG